MPIKHLQDRRRYVRLGKIRLGVQVPYKDKKTGQEKTRPKATDYFVVKGLWPDVEDEVAHIYGEQPKELDIEFLFEEDEETIPQYLKRYRGDGQLGCMGNGEMVLSRRHFFPDGKIDAQVVMDGRYSSDRLEGRVPKGALEGYIDRMMADWKSAYGMVPGETDEVLACLGPHCPQFKPTGCRSTGRLLFGIQGIRRFGFWELVLHQHALVGVNSQFELTRAFTSKALGYPTILNVPFKMRLVGPAKMKIPTRVKKNGEYIMEDRLTDVWTPEIQPDPEWVDRVCERRQGWQEQLEATREEGRLLKAPLKVKPEEEEPLDYQPEDDELAASTPPGAALEAFDAYVEGHKAITEAVAKGVLDKNGDDPVAALAELKQLMGEK